VDRDGGVAPRLVFHGGIQSDEEPAMDPPAGRFEAFGEPRADVRRAHPPVAGVGVVDGDDGHTRPCPLSDKPVSPDRFALADAGRPAAGSTASI